MPGVLGKQRMAAMLDSLRASPPTVIGGMAVTYFEDLRSEEGRFGPLRGATDSSNRNMLLFHLGDHTRLVLRPSGTEPKAKAYIEVSSPPCPTSLSLAQWQEQCRAIDARARTIGQEFVQMATARVGDKP
jgi:phosphoglucomutase/phosphomannomutase